MDNATQARQLPAATADQEVWVQNAIATEIRMALAVAKERRVGADEPVIEGALRGIAEGAAVEIIRTLGLQVPFINLPPYSGRAAGNNALAKPLSKLDVGKKEKPWFLSY